MEMVFVKVVVPNIKGKAIIARLGDLYIIPAMGYYREEEMKYNLDNAVPVPSLLYAMAMLFNDNFEEAVGFIKENW